MLCVSGSHAHLMSLAATSVSTGIRLVLELVLVLVLVSELGTSSVVRLT